MVKQLVKWFWSKSQQLVCRNYVVHKMHILIPLYVCLLAWFCTSQAKIQLWLQRLHLNYICCVVPSDMLLKMNLSNGRITTHSASMRLLPSVCHNVTF